MKNFDTRNFVLLSQALKDLPKKKKTSYSLIGAMGTGGLGGVVPAYALGRAEIAKNRAKKAEDDLKEMTEKSADQTEASQSLYKKSGEALVASGSSEAIAQFIGSTSEEANMLSLQPVSLDDGNVVLPGATVPEFDKKFSEVTLGDTMQAAKQTVVALIHEIAQQNAAQQNDGTFVSNQPSVSAGTDDDGSVGNDAPPEVAVEPDATSPQKGGSSTSRKR